MAHRYVKAPMYVGKSLVIQRGRRDKTVLDGEVLEGREWEKYVAHGLLVPDPNDVEEKAPDFVLTAERARAWLRRPATSRRRCQGPAQSRSC